MATVLLCLMFSATLARWIQAFWCEEIGTYAVALDGEKRQFRVRTSNDGHALFEVRQPILSLALPRRGRLQRHASACRQEYNAEGDIS